MLSPRGKNLPRVRDLRLRTAVWSGTLEDRELERLLSRKTRAEPKILDHKGSFMVTLLS